MKTKILAGLSVGLFLLAAFSALGAANASGPSAVFTMDNASPTNHVLLYQSGPNGVLSLAGTFSAQGAGTGSALASQGALQLTQNGRWLLVVDAGSNQITVFRVDGESLSVADVVASQGNTPISLTVDDNLVYVLNSATPNIAGFTLSNSGQLAFVPGSIQPLSGISNSSPEQIGFVSTSPNHEDQGQGWPDGSVLAVTEKAAGVIDTYTVSRSGIASAPTVIPSNGGGPYGFTTTAQGYLILTEAGTGTLSSYAVSSTGSLRTLSGAMPDFGNAGSATGPAPCWVAVSHDGQFAYVSNAHVGTISVYGISGRGLLNLDSSISAHTLVPTLDLAVSGNNQYLYALNGGQITSFQLYQDGSIAQASAIGGVPASAAGLAAT